MGRPTPPCVSAEPTHAHHFENRLHRHPRARPRLGPGSCAAARTRLHGCRTGRHPRAVAAAGRLASGSCSATTSADAARPSPACRAAAPRSRWASPSASRAGSTSSRPASSGCRPARSPGARRSCSRWSRTTPTVSRGDVPRGAERLHRAARPAARGADPLAHLAFLSAGGVVGLDPDPGGHPGPERDGRSPGAGGGFRDPAPPRPGHGLSGSGPAHGRHARPGTTRAARPGTGSARGVPRAPPGPVRREDRPRRKHSCE